MSQRGTYRSVGLRRNLDGIHVLATQNRKAAYAGVTIKDEWTGSARRPGVGHDFIREKAEAAGTIRVPWRNTGSS
ncbi:hypothetical protein AHiyo6_21340, partial [Arthrobacter sp. Hiyo6]